MTYDTKPYICPEPRFAGWHDAACRVTWTPTDGDPVTVIGDYLDGDGPAGPITLGCGIEAAVTDLGLEDLVFSRDEDYAVSIAEAVDHQLARRTWALLACPEGTLRVELVAWELIEIQGRR